MAGSRSTASELAPAAEPRRSGRTELEGRSLAFSVASASRLSLHVAFEGGTRLPDGTVLDWVELQAEQRVRLGRCRFASDNGAPLASTGRLVFLDDVYDCQSLVREGRFMDLRGFFQNLPLVLAQRERV